MTQTVTEGAAELLAAMQTLCDKAEARGHDAAYRVSGQVFLDEDRDRYWGKTTIRLWHHVGPEKLAASIEQGDSSICFYADDPADLAEQVLDRVAFRENVERIDEAAAFLLNGVRDRDGTYVVTASKRLARGLREVLAADGWTEQDEAAVKGLTGLLDRLAAKVGKDE